MRLPSFPSPSEIRPVPVARREAVFSFLIVGYCTVHFRSVLPVGTLSVYKWFHRYVQVLCCT